MVLGNCVPLWEIMLAAIRLGAVIIPATPQLSAQDLDDRVERGDAKLLVAGSGDAGEVRGPVAAAGQVLIGRAILAPVEGWIPVRASRTSSAPTRTSRG